MADAGPVSPRERTRETERTLLGGDPLALVSGELLRTLRVPSTEALRLTSANPTGVKVTDAELAAVPLSPHEWHGDWNYTLRPTRDTPEPD